MKQRKTVVKPCTAQEIISSLRLPLKEKIEVRDILVGIYKEGLNKLMGIRKKDR